MALNVFGFYSVVLGLKRTCIQICFIYNLIVLGISYNSVPFFGTQPDVISYFKMAEFFALHLYLISDSILGGFFGTQLDVISYFNCSYTKKIFRIWVAQVFRPDLSISASHCHIYCCHCGGV